MRTNLAYPCTPGIMPIRNILLSYVGRVSRNEVYRQQTNSLTHTQTLNFIILHSTDVHVFHFLLSAYHYLVNVAVQCWVAGVAVAPRGG